MSGPQGIRVGRKQHKRTRKKSSEKRMKTRKNDNTNVIESRTLAQILMSPLSQRRLGDIDVYQACGGNRWWHRMTKYQ